MGLSMDDPFEQIVTAPDRVVLDGIIQSGISTVIDPINPDVLNLTGINLAPQNVLRGTNDNVLLGINLWTFGSADGLAFLDKIRLSYTGDTDTDIMPSGIKIYDDLNNGGSYEEMYDKLLGAGTFEAGTTEVDIIDLKVQAGREKNLLIALDICPEAILRHLLFLHHLK